MAFGSIVSLMLPAFSMCILLVGLLSYLGIHVIKREIIFVDLALAQIAALGSLIGFLLGIPLHSQGSYAFAVALTAIAAVIFTFTRMRDSKVPQEAVIGLVYAIAAATAILLIDKAPHGAEHVKDILTGSVLWVAWKTVLATLIVFAAVGIFHYVFRERFLLVAEDPERAERLGVNVRAWDFLFYLSFGFVITMSVDTAGVLLVFVFLVAPAVMAILVADRLLHQLIFGWALGVAVTTAGLFLSYLGDLPSGPMVIGMYAIALVVVAAITYNLRAADHRRAALNTLIAAAAFAAVFALLFAVGHVLAGMQSQSGDVHAHEFHGAIAEAAPAAPPPRAPTGFDSSSNAAPAAGRANIRQMVQAYEASDDPEKRVELISQALKADKREGVALGLRFLATGPPLFFAQTVVEELDVAIGEPTGFDAAQPFSAPVNQQAAARIATRYHLEM
jgi:zinc/manganese transport system permease protein